MIMLGIQPMTGVPQKNTKAIAGAKAPNQMPVFRCGRRSTDLRWHWPHQNCQESFRAAGATVVFVTDTNERWSQLGHWNQ